MKKIIHFLCLSMLFYSGGMQAAPPSDKGFDPIPFTYQGQLTDNNSLPTNTYDFEFLLFNAASAGVQVGSTLTKQDVPVTDGIFQVELDFNIFFDDSDYWLEVHVRPGNSTGPYTTLSPRQSLTFAPKAIFAINATAADVAFSADIASAGPFWYLNGNTGPGNFLGTRDTNALEFRTNNKRVGLISDATDNQSNHSPNVLLGSENNIIDPAAHGATISGGGGDPGSTFCGNGGNQQCVNTVLDDFGTVSGGWGNYADLYSFVGGGQANLASGNYATIGGGQGNKTADLYAAIGGGISNFASSLYTSIVGGYANTASAEYATVCGGDMNVASGYMSTVAGGSQNLGSGAVSTVAGGYKNQAGGDFSLAAGRQALVRDAAATGDADGDEGTFVWADSTQADFISTGPNQFLVRASGGVGLGTNNPNGHQLNVLGSTFLRNSTDTSTAADLVLGGSSGNATDDGVLTTDLSIAGSDLIIRSNDAVVVVLDNDTTSDGSFTVRDGSGTDLFKVAGNGDVTIPGNLTVNGTITGTVAKKGGALPAPEEQPTTENLSHHQIQQLQQRVAVLEADKQAQQQQLMQLQQALQALQASQQQLLTRLRTAEGDVHTQKPAQ